MPLESLKSQNIDTLSFDEIFQNIFLPLKSLKNISQKNDTFCVQHRISIDIFFWLIINSSEWNPS